MFTLNPIKIMVIVAVVLVLLGPDKLPEVAHRLGSSWRALKRLQERVETEVRDALPDLPSTSDLARMARSPVNLLNQLADKVDEKEAAATVGDVTPVPGPDQDAPAPAPPPVRRAEPTALPPDPSMN